MSRKTRITHEMIKAVDSKHRFGEDKHELKKEARRLSRETGKRHTVKGVSHTEKTPLMQLTRNKQKHSLTG